jgi:cyanophycinase
VTGALHLLGGGWGGDGATWRGFLDEATTSAGDPRGGPVVAVLVVRDGDGEEHAKKLVQCLQAAGPFVPRVAVTAHGGTLDPAVLDGVHGVFVGGGRTPAYLDALLPLKDPIRRLVAAGAPYGGFSAGAAIAAERALLGGWRQDGVPVVEKAVAHDLDGITVRDGLGLTPLTVEVHAAQWGTLARLIAAVEASTVDRGAAIDEDTALLLRGDAHEVTGGGNVWWVEPADGAVAVRRQPPTR